MKNAKQQGLNQSWNLPCFNPKPAYEKSKSLGDVPLNICSPILSEHMNVGSTPSLKNPIKGLVSKNKRRFEWDGYNLDLTYITDNILAMGFPSENLEALYRNSLGEVEAFLEQRHRGHYRVYNLCKQKHYAEDRFQGKFVEYPFEDHNAPPFELIYRCCADMKQFIEEDKQNIAAIHCKAGKGRTGVIISCCLLFMGVFSTAEECLNHYAEVRTLDGKGVTIPSQIRYVKYFQTALGMGINSEVDYFEQNRKIKINCVKMNYCPQIHVFGGCTPWVSIITQNREFRSKYSHELNTYQTDEPVEITFKMPFQIQRDFKVTFFTKGKVIKKSEQIMRVWLNCIFLPFGSIQLTMNDMDGVKPTDKRFRKDCVIELFYKET